MVDALRQHPLEGIAGQRTHGHPHVDRERALGLESLDADPAGRDLRNALDDVESPGGRGKCQNSTAEIIEGRAGYDTADPPNLLSLLGNSLRYPDSFEPGINGGFFDISHEPLRDHRAGQFVVAHQDRPARPLPFLHRFERIDNHTLQRREPTLQNPAVGELHTIATGPSRRETDGDRQADGRPMAYPPRDTDGKASSVIHHKSLAGCLTRPPPGREN